MTTLTEVFRQLQNVKFSLHSEKVLQGELSARLVKFMPEYHLNERNIIDFYCDGIGIEVKIKGSKRRIYEQIRRYCEFEQVEKLIVLTSKSIGLPEKINNRPVFVINLAKAWL
jgi:hypothetical protein